MNTTPAIDNLLQAISFVARAHGEQVRKDRQTPYAAHPMRAMTVLALVFQVSDVELLITALLHDTIEDTTVDFDDLHEQFGPAVAQNVALLTKDMRRQEEAREASYRDTLAAAPIGVQLCKLADVYDNLLDSTALSSEARAKTVRKATELLELFRGQLAEHWPHVLDAVQQQIERTQACS